MFRRIRKAIGKLRRPGGIFGPKQERPLDHTCMINNGVIKFWDGHSRVSLAIGREHKGHASVTKEGTVYIVEVGGKKMRFNRAKMSRTKE